MRSTRSLMSPRIFGCWILTGLWVSLGGPGRTFICGYYTGKEEYRGVAPLWVTSDYQASELICEMSEVAPGRLRAREMHLVRFWTEHTDASFKGLLSVLTSYSSNWLILFIKTLKGDMGEIPGSIRNPYQSSRDAMFKRTTS